MDPIDPGYPKTWADMPGPRRGGAGVSDGRPGHGFDPPHLHPPPAGRVQATALDQTSRS